MPRKKKVRYPIHNMGKTCGYEEYEDGSIKIAPVLSKKMDALLSKRASIKDLMDSIINHCQELNTEIQSQVEGVWEEIHDEYGLDYVKCTYKYSFRSGIVSKNINEGEKECQTT